MSSGSAPSPPPSGVIRLKVRTPTASADAPTIDVDPSISVEDLRVLVFAATDVPENRQKLVYAGRVLRDGTLVRDYGVQDGGTLFLVVSTPPPAQAGISGAHLAGMPQVARDRDRGDPMAALLEGPLMQMIAANPELFRTMLAADPRMRQLMESNPEMGAALRDPATLQQLFVTSRNPAARREMERAHDRALAHIESMPGGYAALERMYTTTIAPLERATRDEAESPSSAAASTTSPTPPRSSDRINTDALPNPWAPPPPASRPGNGAFPLFGGDFCSGAGQSAGPSLFGSPFPFPFITPEIPSSTVRSPVSRAGGGRGGVAASLSPPAPAAAPETAYPAQLEHLCAMGFARDRAAAAIVRARGDVDAAAAALLDEQDGGGEP